MNIDIRESSRRPIERLTRPLRHFLHIESASGVVLLICTAIALGIANSPLAAAYNGLLQTNVSIGIGGFTLSYPLWYWVNDGLMTIFFFLVGLEIKQEISAGELRSPRRMLVPIVAAIGGAVLPAAIYTSLQYGQAAGDGWAIPMATDIAFVVGALAILGRHIPRSLKVFVLALAIVDDIIAVLVIALFYSGQLKLVWLASALAGLAVVIVMHRLGVRTVIGYLLAGTAVWLCTLKSGIHPTIAGVILGLLTPTTPLISRESLQATLRKASAAPSADPLQEGKVMSQNILEEVRFASREAISPLERLETAVHPWSAFAIMPIFALVNAGIPFSLTSITNPAALAVMSGLVIGKPLGIALALFLLVKSGIAHLPERVTWKMIIGAGCLAGIGFTMSLFVASLSLTGELLIDAKSGILVGSAISAILGMLILRLSTNTSAGEVRAAH